MKLLSRPIFLSLLCIVVLYFGLRLVNLTLQPVFVDEAIYIRWSQKMILSPYKFLIPLSDGKTPLFMWSMVPSLLIFNDPLFAGRIMSVFTGFLTLLGGFYFGWRFLNQRVALTSAFLITISPYLFFFDRMALADSFLAASLIWLLNIALLTVEKPTYKKGLLLISLSVSAILIKTPALLGFLLLPLTLLMLNLRKVTERKKGVYLFLIWLSLLICAIGGLSLLRLNPTFKMVSSRSQDYFFPTSRLFEVPFDPFVIHFPQFMEWVPQMLTYPIWYGIGLAAFWALLSRQKIPIILLLWALIPNLIFVSLIKSYTTRYILFTIPPVLILLAWGMDSVVRKIRLFQRGSLIILLAFFAFFCLRQDLLLLTHPEKAQLPRETRRGYFEDWTAGYGIKDIATYIKGQAIDGPVVVATNSMFGVFAEGLEMYLFKFPNTKVVVDVHNPSLDLPPLAKKQPTYFVSNRWSYVGGDHLELLEEYPKVKGPDVTEDALLFFKVNH
jgi:4-amino-4-deoxy-L-arabinose transferase-like glycosyltransferase